MLRYSRTAAVPSIAMAYHPPTRAAVPPAQPVLVYDGSCPFCTWVARFAQRHARLPLAVVPFQDVYGRGWLTALSEHEVAAMAHLVLPGGREYHGGESVTRTLRMLPGGALAGLLDLPLAWRLREAGYAVVSHARPLLARAFR